MGGSFWGEGNFELRRLRYRHRRADVLPFCEFPACEFDTDTGPKKFKMNRTKISPLHGSSAQKETRRLRPTPFLILFSSIAFAPAVAGAQNGLPSVTRPPVAMPSNNLPPPRTPSDLNSSGTVPRSNSPVLTSAPSDTSPTGMPGGVCRLVGGMAAAQLKQCFGEPDEVGEEKGRQVWHYGDCQLYVSEERLVAWLNPEDLADRRRMAALARRSDKDYDPTDKAHWVNEWTPRKEVLPQEELLDLVGEDEGQRITETAPDTGITAEDAAAIDADAARPTTKKGSDSQDIGDPLAEDRL